MPDAPIDELRADPAVHSAQGHLQVLVFGGETKPELPSIRVFERDFALVLDLKEFAPEIDLGGPPPSPPAWFERDPRNNQGSAALPRDRGA